MDPFGQSPLSPSDFFNGLDIAPHQTLPHPQPILPGPRNYKSRKYRPCDFCRARQVACKIEVAPPCQLCTSHSRECTFVERPKKKRRPNQNSISNGPHANPPPPPPPPPPPANDVRQIDPALTLDHGNGHLDNGYVPQFDERLFERSLGHDHYLDAQGSPEHIPPHALNNHVTSPDFHGSPANMSMALQDRPLDSQATRSARFLGETGEINPYLLRHYRYDENDECTISKLTYRRIKRTSQLQDQLTGNRGEPPVVFMLADDSFAQKGEPRIEDDILAKCHHDVMTLFSEEEGMRLVGLYFRFVDPYFPVLPRSEMFINGHVSHEAFHTMPLSLRSAIYATALPFVLYDDLLAATIIHNPPSTSRLFRVTWLCVMNELHTPRLATLQACLLLLQRAPTNRFTTDTPWKTSLVGWTVSLAQILGLTHDCSDWSTLPAYEIALRKRLWHAVYIMDKWASLGAGMPSHIRPEDYDVPPLLPSDCDPSLAADIYHNHQHDPHHPHHHPHLGFPGPSEADAHFRLLSELTTILSDIHDAYYTVRATARTATDFALSLDLARPLRTRLKAWNDSLPPALSLRYADRIDSRGMSKLSGNPSLSLAYIVATMTLFRALLRPLDNLSAAVGEDDHTLVGSRLAVRAGAKECAKEVVEFVENLGRGALDAFWHSWSRSNFAIASSFLMQLLLTAESAAESAELNDLVTRWRWAMRIGSGSGSGSAGSGLMSLGLLRLDGMLLENGGVGMGALVVGGGFGPIPSSAGGSQDGGSVNGGGGGGGVGGSQNGQVNGGREARRSTTGMSTA